METWAICSEEMTEETFQTVFELQWTEVRAGVLIQQDPPLFDSYQQVVAVAVVVAAVGVVVVEATSVVAAIENRDHSWRMKVASSSFSE